MNRSLARDVLIFAGIVLALIIGVRLTARILVDYWWFAELDYASVFTRILWTRVWLWVVGFAVAFGGVAVGIVLAQRRIGPPQTSYVQWGNLRIRVPSLHRYMTYATWAVAGLMGLGGGAATMTLWHRVLLFMNRQPFGVSDPLFGQDVGFYTFTYPLLLELLPLLQGLAWVSLAVALLLYISAGAFSQQRQWFLSRPAFLHLCKGVGVLLVLGAAGFFLKRYDLLYTEAGVVFGAGYTDVKVRVLACWVMAVASLGAAAVFFAIRAQQQYARLIAALAAWAGCAVLFFGVLPPAVQWIRVEPNELELETPYIRHNIEMTRRAYGLHDIEEVEYPVREDLTYEDVRSERETVENIRVWDRGPLATTLQEIQGIRPYYDFSGIAVDRYELDDVLTQLMLSVRELNSRESKTWVSRRLLYTHGYGLCAAPVNESTEEGLPVLMIRDIPPVTPPGLPLDRPQVYYGRNPAEYVFVNTGTEEFDYPVGTEGHYTHYDGQGGVPVAGRFRKLMFATEFRDMKILLSDELVEGSRVMYRRNVSARVRRLAPYLALDDDPYAVIHEGGIKWIQDAFTVSAHFPYSEPVQGKGVNYLRNSVKVVMDAYDGDATFYVADPSDPIIKAYMKIFPNLYRPMEDMPDGLRAHVRYPKDLFNVQAGKLRVYHVQDPRVFFQREDVWEVPREQYLRSPGQTGPGYGPRARPMRSYYVTMRLPGYSGAEFILMMPFTPKEKNNMIAWLAARCDGENYGELKTFRFPKGKWIPGPNQVEATIDQNTEISQQLTLWSQRGSGVTRGNLLVIPVAGGVLYVEPLYIQAEQAAVPQLKRIIVAYGGRVAMRKNLEESIRALFGIGEPAAGPVPQPEEPGARGYPAQAAELLQRTVRQYEEAAEALKEYRRRMDEMEETLRRLERAIAPEEDEEQAE